MADGLLNSSVSQPKNTAITPQTGGVMPASGLMNSTTTTNADGMVTGVQGGPIQSSYDQGGQIQSSYNPGGQVQTQLQTNNLNPLSTSSAAGNFQGVNMSGVGSLASASDLNQQMTAAQQAAYKQSQSRLDPTWTNQANDLRNQLVQQGIMQNSDAWNRAMDDFSRQRTDAYQTAENNSIGLGNAAQAQLFGQGLATNQNAYNQAYGNTQLANQAASQLQQNNQFNSQLANQANQQQFMQNLNAGQFANSAQAQGNQQNMNAAQFANQAQNQANTQNFQAGQFGNYAQNQGFNQGIQNANLVNPIYNNQANRDTSAKNAQTNGLFGLAGMALQNPNVTSGLGGLLSSGANAIGNWFGGTNFTPSTDNGFGTQGGQWTDPNLIQQLPYDPTQYQGIDPNNWGEG